MIEVGTTSRGYTIYKQENKDIGGWDYVSDSVGGGWTVVNALASIEELELILADMKKPSREEVKKQVEEWTDIYTEVIDE